MNERPSSAATVLWLVVAVWLLSALAVFTGIPGNVVGAMLIVGHAAAAADALLLRHQRCDGRTLASVRAPVVRPSARSRPAVSETPHVNRSFRTPTFRPGVTPMRMPIAFALVLLVVALISMSRIAVGHDTGLGLAAAKLVDVATGGRHHGAD